jgi:cobalt/nickel transport system ATP-binding protein
VNDTLIDLKDITFAYQPERPVLRGANLQLNVGERIALVGANGSGKSTLFHIIAGLIHPDSGEIRAFGKTRTKEKDFHEVRARAGLLFQEAEDQLFCPTVLEDIAFGPLNLGLSTQETMDRVHETLDALGISGFENRITYKLSAGEKRLVALATVLAMKPEVLLLDEPAAGLDEHAEEKLISILKELPQAMLVVSHNRTFLRHVTERSVCLSNGQITADC